MGCKSSKTDPNKKINQVNDEIYRSDIFFSFKTLMNIEFHKIIFMISRLLCIFITIDKPV